MGRVATDTALNAFAAALGQVAHLELGMDKALDDFRGLKEGRLKLENLVVTDGGWEFMPDAAG
jgi:hypothetical protein